MRDSGLLKRCRQHRFYSFLLAGVIFSGSAVWAASPTQTDMLALLNEINQKLDQLSQQSADLSGVTQNWNKKIQAAQRFVVLADLNNQAVLDKETGLVWEQAPSITGLSWNTTRHQCVGRTTGGRKGWRLPSIAELQSLIDPTQSNPALLPGHPFSNVQNGFYWSATTDAEFATNAWNVQFSGGLPSASPKSNNLFVWCVRGGHNDSSVY